jgi:thiol:disulfide interchange protein/DsbC/DsbD-like thiol-disulfide interchange protein
LKYFGMMSTLRIMHRFGRRGFIFFLSLCPLLLFAGASPVKKGAVTAELVARETSIQPGRPFWVALKLVHDEHWHSYWINPGTGYPTSLTWTLPPGFSAGPVTWPTPHVVKDISGKITGLGYEGEVWFFSQITPPASLPSGSTASLHAKAEWLMCKDVCMPGDAQLELSLPVRDETPAENSAVAEKFDSLFSRLPKPDPAWTVSATRSPKIITLRISSASGNTHHPKNLHFFDRDGLLDYAAPQNVREEAGAYVIELAVSPDAKPDIAELAGVLASDNGWKQEDESYSGIEVDVPLAAAVSAPASHPNPATLVLRATEAPAESGLARLLILGFFGGLILNLMPCVFPVLGIKILGFVHQSGSDRRKITMHGIVFALGVLISFWALAGTLLVLRAGGSQLGWGAQFQSPAFVFCAAVFMLVFALNMSGLFEVGLVLTGVGGGLQMKEGYAGSFFTGALAVLVSTPCSAPMLAPALGAALSSAFSSAEAMSIFTCIAVGLAMPYLLLSIFPQAVKFLPRPGAWMETFKQFMAFPLYGTVGWFLWILAAQTAADDHALLLIIFGLVLIAMAGWIYGRFGHSHGHHRHRRVGHVAALVFLIGGLWLGWPTSPHVPAPGEHAGFTVNWEKWSPEAVASAQKTGHFVYVDFTARWCATCQTNKAAVFHSDEVLAEFARRNVVLLRGDWTSKDAAITAELARWNRSAVPFNLIYAPDKPNPVILPELLTPGKVLSALEEAAK